MPGDRQEDVDLAEGLDALVAQALERGDVGDIGGDRQRAAAAVLNLGGDVLDELDAAAGRDHVGARVGQTERERAADPARTTDDDGRTAGQIEQLHEVGQADEGRRRTRARREDGGDAGTPPGACRRARRAGMSASATGSCDWCRLAWSR